MCVAHSVSISKVTLIQRSPNGRRRIAFVNAPVAPPQTTAGSSSGQVSITGNEKVVATTLPNVTTEQQPLALGKKRLDETTPKDPDHQVTPIKRPLIFPSKSQGQICSTQRVFLRLDRGLYNPLMMTETGSNTLTIYQSYCLSPKLDLKGHKTLGALKKLKLKCAYR